MNNRLHHKDNYVYLNLEKSMTTGKTVPMNTPNDEWDKVAGWLVPPDASPIQRQAMHLSFCIGVAAAIRLHLAMASNNISEADFENEIKKWMSEINDVVSHLIDERCGIIH